MHAAVWRSATQEPRISVAHLIRPAALIAAVAVLVSGLVLARTGDTTSIDGSPSAVWMSGEELGRVVLAPARAERPSVAVEIGDENTMLDVVDLAQTVVVHDRTAAQLVRLDGRTGEELSRESAPGPAGDRPLLAGAGSVAYLVDPAARSARAITADGELLAAVVAEDVTFSSWVTTSDGLLWIADDLTGSIIRFDGERFDVTTGFAVAESGLRLTAVRTDPVVFDPTSGRLRWPRRNVSVDVPGATPGAAVVLQQPDPDGTCVGVVAGTTWSCLDPVAAAVSGQIAGPLDLTAGTVLFAGTRDFVLARSGDGAIEVIDRAAGTVSTAERRAPSTRPLLGRIVTGAVVVDDPGSRFAFTVDRGRFVELDKFSLRTVVISGDEVTEDGVGTIDEDADVAGVFAEGADQPLDDNGTNDGPIARDDEVVTRVGRTITVSVLANDSDPENDPLTVTSAGPVAVGDGEAEVIQGSRVQYRPPESSDDRTIRFPYSIADTGTLTSDASVVVEIIGSGRNSAPTVEDDEATTQQNQSIDLRVTSNDTDAEGDPLTVSAVTDPTSGTVAIADDIVRYEPLPGFTGSDSFEYTVVDGYGGEAAGRVELEVIESAAVNRPPDAKDDRTAVQTGVRLRIDPLANDVDPDGDRLRIVSTSALTGVELGVVGQGSIDILAGPTVSGLVSFTYTVEDTGGLQDTARVVLVVELTEALAAPIAVDDRATSAGLPVAIDVTANDIDPGGGQLLVDSLTQPPVGGSVARISPTSIEFVPTPGFVGTARFSYDVINALGLRSTGAVTVEVTAPSGSGPLARDDSVTAFVGDRIVIDALSNDSHPDGLPFDYSGAPTARGGTVSVNPDRTLTFVPPTGELGTFVVTYGIQDRNLRTSRATITVVVVARPLTNRPPLVSGDTALVPFGESATIDVLGNDTDPDGDTLRLTDIGIVSAGSAEISGSRIRYTPATGFSGVATVGYTASDPSGASANGVLTVQVAERVRVAPLARPDLVNLITDATTVANPLANDVDPDGTPGSLSLVRLGSSVPAGVSAVVAGAGVRITAGRSTGTFEVAYTIADADGQQAVGTITVIVNLPPNTAPIAVNDSTSTLAQGGSFKVLDNDLDLEGGVISLMSAGPVSPASAGTATVSGDRVVWDLVSTFQGTATIPYTIRDAQGATGTATLTLVVTACPAVPSLQPISMTTAFRTPVTVPLFPGGVPAGSTITIGAANPGSAVSSSGGASALYTPPQDFNGNATFTYSARTTCGAIATNTVTVTVNRPPTAVNDTASTGRNTPVVVPVLANDTDPDNDVLRVQSVGNFQNGTADLTAGTVTFTPTTGFTGTASFTYRIVDVGGYTSTGRVTVTVANAPPQANADAYDMFTLIASANIDVIANDSDPNNDPLQLVSVGAVSPASAGTATRSGNLIVFTPTPGSKPQTGITMTYTISDGIATSSSTLAIAIVNRPPVAGADVASIDLATQTSVVVDVLANDTDPDGVPGSLVVTGVTASAGTFTRVGGVITWTPTGVAAPATVIVAYTIADVDGGTTGGSLTISVTDSTPPPPTTSPPITAAPPGP